MREDQWVKAGWERKFIACEPRLSEAKTLYEEAGFEVHLEPLAKQSECSSCIGIPAQAENEGECRVCFEGVEEQYRIIYIRPIKSK
jgi:hypothetical protein